MSAAVHGPEIEKLAADLFSLVRRFLYVEVLGQGAMGVVFRAHDTELGEDVALKLLLNPVSSDDTSRGEAVARFKREVSLNRKIKHPNVARLHDIGVAGPYWYLTMEFVPGRNLEDLIEHDGPMPPERAVPILRQICQGVAAAHRAGVIHRDLKPGNVLVDESGGVAILDFGLARGRLDCDITQSGLVVGTPAYMAPEQLIGGTVTERSDIYSIGSLAFHVLTGRLPFQKDTPLALGMSVINDPVPVDVLHRAALPAPLVAIVLRCLSKSPAARPATAEEVDSELARVVTRPTGELAGGGAEPRAPQPFGTMELNSYRMCRPVVLVVDDDPLQRQALAAWLGHADCHTLEAADGREALELLSTRRVDLVLLDVLMPVMDGFDTLRVLRTMPGIGRVPVILTSSFPERNRLAFAIQAGATDFVPKAVPGEEMVERVWSVLARDGFWRQ